MRRAALRVLLALLLCLPFAAAAHADAAPKVYVTIWFDAEDYLLPADDDATLRLAEFLSREGIRATFKMVGEKARVLEQRGRGDVIAALKHHEIGYHTDFHSVQPTIALFLSTQGWDDGVAEFDRRERQGLDDLTRIFGQKPSCWGQPGSSWGPQVYGALRQWGVPVYLDAGSHIRVNGKPFWYGGALNLYALEHTRRTGLAKASDLDEAKAEFQRSHETLVKEGGGIVSIYYHPCEFVHRQFWDGVNFAKGANPPRAQWRIPPQKSPEETAQAFANFEGYIRHVKSFAGVEFVTALDSLKIYGDRTADLLDQSRQNDANSAAFSIEAIAEQVKPQITFVETQGHLLSPSETLLLLNRRFVERTGGKPAVQAEPRTPFGPTMDAPALAGDLTVALDQFARTAADVDQYIARHGRVPNAVWLGSQPVSPERYLYALAELTLARLLPEHVTFDADVDVRLAAADYVSEDNPSLWGWVIFPEGFKAPEMMKLAKRQAWTLKPARRTN